jgi:hypothetical protein
MNPNSFSKATNLTAPEFLQYRDDNIVVTPGRGKRPPDDLFYEEQFAAAM